MRGYVAGAAEFPAEYALFVTTETGETNVDLRTFCRKYEEAVAIALGAVPVTLWFRRGQLLGILHLFENADAMDNYVACQPMQSMKILSLHRRSIFMEQFEVVQFERVPIPAAPPTYMEELLPAFSAGVK